MLNIAEEAKVAIVIIQIIITVGFYYPVNVVNLVFTYLSIMLKLKSLWSKHNTEIKLNLRLKTNIRNMTLHTTKLKIKLRN